jgi:hypothetical protein
VPDDIVGDAGVLGGGGAGRYYYPLRFLFLDFLDSGLVIAYHHHLLTQLAQILEEVIGKAVIIIYQ